MPWIDHEFALIQGKPKILIYFIFSIKHIIALAYFAAVDLLGVHNMAKSEVERIGGSSLDKESSRLDK